MSVDMDIMLDWKFVLIHVFELKRAAKYGAAARNIFLSSS